MKEVDYFNFNTLIDDNLDMKIKNLAKLHKFLKTNLSTYQAKCCSDFNVLKDDETLNAIDFIPNDQINVSYVLLPYENISHISGINGDFQTKTESYINLVYLLGNNSATSTPPGQEPTQKPEVVKKPAPSKSSKKKKGNDKKEPKPVEDSNNDGGRENIIYGRIMINEKFLLNLNQRIYSLKTKCRMSLTFSEEKKNRDYKYYQLEYYDLI